MAPRIDVTGVVDQVAERVVLEDDVEELPALFLGPLVASIVSIQEPFSKGVGLLPLFLGQEDVAVVKTPDEVHHCVHRIEHASLMPETGL